MLAHKSARIRQLSGGLYVEEPAAQRISLQPRFRVETISQHDKSFAESVLKREASAVRGSQHLLRRANGSAEVAQIYIDRLFLDAVQSNKQLQVPDVLLGTAEKNANINLVRLLAPFTAIEAVSAVLEYAVLSQNLQLVTALLEYGADPNCISHSSILRLAETNCQLLHVILRAPKQLRHETFGDLCTTIVQKELSNALRIVLRSIKDYPTFHDSGPRDRDSLLDAAICCSDKSIFLSIAASTSAWPLRDPGLFLHVLDSPAIDPLQAKDMVEALLCLSDMSSGSQSSPEIESFYCRCVQERHEDILRLMVAYGVPVSAEPLMLACQNHDENILDILLAGPIQKEEQVAARTSELQGAIQRAMCRKILKRLLSGGARGIWKNEELIAAVSRGEFQWIETLISANASVDYHNGAALLEAVSLGHVRVVQTLLSRPVSLSSLQAAFPSIAQLEALPRRLLTKLFINQGVSGGCVDYALNTELCNYSYHRDSEIVDILIGSGACCNAVALTVAFEHKDAATFDKIALSRTKLHESVTEWFKSWHRMLLFHVQQGDEYSKAACSCLKMLFRKLQTVESLCDAHEGDRQLECFHQFLEHGAADLDLLSAWLNWTQHMNSITLTEIVLTAACFCDTNRLHLIMRSKPLINESPLHSSTCMQNLNLDPQAKKANIFPSVQIPPLRQDVIEFSDTRSADNLKILFRQYFHGGCESHLATRLLQRHLEHCTQAIAEGDVWPLLTLEFLLSQPVETTLPEFSSCLYMAIVSQQWLVLGLLLDRQLPQEMVARFFLVDTSLLAPSAIQVLLDSKAMTYMDDDFYYGPVQQTFNHACFAQDREMAILLCSKSRCKMRLRDVLLPVLQAIDASDLSYVSTLIGATSFSKDDLEVLWKRVSHHDQKDDYLAFVDVLLKAGADGVSVGDALIAAVERNNEPLVVLILAQWQANRSLQYREEFDYNERRPAPSTPDLGHNIQYFSALAHALTIAVAVAKGSYTALVEMIISSETRPDFNGVVNFALVQVVVHNRGTWVQSLVQLGGSIEAYDCECLKFAARSDHPVCQILQGRLAAYQGDLDTICAMFKQLHETGFQEKAWYDEALFSLLALQSANLDHVKVLLDCGASVEYRDGAGMIRLWREGNVQLFPDLVGHCSRQSVRTKLFTEAWGEYLQQEQNHPEEAANMLLVLGALLETDIPQGARDMALDAIARVCHDKVNSIGIIQLLLEKGARFIDGAGLSLYQVCRFDHPPVTSLVYHSRPHIRTRLLALHHLFRNQGLGSSIVTRRTGQEPNPSDQACIYNINFPASTAQNLDLETSDVVNLMGSILNPKVRTTGTSLMFTFFFMLGGLHVFSTQSCSDHNRDDVEQLFVAAISNSEVKEMDDRIEFLLRVMQIEAPALADATAGASNLTLKQSSLDKLLLLSLQNKKFSLASTLLDAGADPNTRDEDERSALFLATLEKSLDTMRDLIGNGAEEDDGSLHVSTCWQHHEAMQLLLEAGHEPGYCSEHYFGATPLEAFLRFSHSGAAHEHFETTLAVLLCEAEVPTSFWATEPNLMSLALMGPWPYKMFSALLCYLPPGLVELPLIRQDRFMFSLLSFVERGEDIELSDLERVELSIVLETSGFERTFYAAEGDQPEDAFNVPEHLEIPEVRARRRAWRGKDCAVCGDKAPDANRIHAALSPPCEEKHGWENDIICTDCLRGYLESQMFPQGGDKFPSAKVKCWATNCSKTLDHSVIQSLAQSERFTIYDAALAQMLLNDGENMAKCAKPKCIGATWLGDEDKNTTIFACDVCDEPCPQGDEARGIERRREEEAATAALLAQGKKCPKCRLPFERIEGCDHIVCGRDAHSSARGLGCAFEFCYVCGADYNAIRTQGNTAHARSCTHYA
ncbi:hypothetical protein AYO20_01795 [Fonsecaea nubica]|uniref:RBR-type E3 ubiquitin transferase n=1 Tax=Fonsecaea nubica TaxID=856822 RepID=A0A178DCK3_9EURO|nr:hypothetical protein AYO20_01795 [Fonsecaea nubica]OAL39044.1 hypothetical protein AYO20_01795 [Fonsecaea nubica]